MSFINKDRPITVEQLCKMTDSTLCSLGSICVVGEISEQSRSSSKHHYLQLKGGEYKISATVWSSKEDILKGITNGMEVEAKGTLRFSGKYNSMSFWVDEIRPVGKGRLAAEQEARRQKYQDLGWFDMDKKKPMPTEISHIGVITSPQGAVIHDLVDVLTRLAPHISISIFPCMVQGVGAEKTIASQIRHADTFGLDLLVVMRGGGSVDDLAPFSTDDVVQAIHYANTPVLSAVGHESDFSLSDFVADIRAGTPSIAGEMISAQTVRRRNTLRATVSEMDSTMKMRLYDAKARFAGVSNLKDALKFRAAKAQSRLTTASFLETLLHQKVVGASMNLMGAGDELDRGIRERLAWERSRLELMWTRSTPLVSGMVAAQKVKLTGASKELEALNPYSILERGYSMVRTPEGHVVTGPQDLRNGDKINIKTAGGNIDAVVTK